jgi:hypothetical protein
MTLSRLMQPQADTILRYLPSLQVFEPKLQTPFTPAEQNVLADFMFNTALVYPFQNSQRKPATGESRIIAHHQSAHDGAGIVRYFDDFIILPTAGQRWRLSARMSPSPVKYRRSISGCIDVS